MFCQAVWLVHSFLSCRLSCYYYCLFGVLRLFKSYIYFLYVYIVYLFSCYLCLLLMLFLVIFVLIGKCFYINCGFLLFCGKALVIFVRLVFFILLAALCSRATRVIWKLFAQFYCGFCVFSYRHYCLCYFTCFLVLVSYHYSVFLLFLCLMSYYVVLVL